MMWIVRLALRRPYTFALVALLILVFGIATILRMPKDILPDVDIPIVAVIWQYDGLAPSEMEQRIVTPSERTFTTTVSDIEHMESQSLSGVASIRVYFQPGANIESAISQINASAESLLRRLPPGVTAPLIIRFRASNVPVIQMDIHSDTLPEEQLFDYATNFIRQPVTKVRGAQIPLPYGGRSRSVVVDLNPQALFAYGIAPSDVSNSINAQNLVLPGGTVKIDKTQYPVLLNSSPTVVDQLNDIPIKSINGKTVFIRDIAQVRDGFTPQENIVRSNGKHSVLLTVLKNGERSTLDIINDVKAALPGIRAQIPPDLKVDTLFDQSVFVRDSIRGVILEGVIAACLTATMILLFLGSLRSTLIVAVSIPLSILVSLMLLFALGETINIMTLGGLALAVGILVDDATVEVENIHRNLSMNKPIRRAILDGAQEIALPALVSTLSICIVFVPVFLITGPAAALFTPLALAVIFAMVTSYLLSRTLVPTLVMYLLRGEVELYQNQGQAGDGKQPEAKPGANGATAKPAPENTAKPAGAKKDSKTKSNKKKKKNPADSWLWKFHLKFEEKFEKMRERYKNALGWALDHPWPVLILFGVLCGLSFFLLPFLGRDFFPEVDSGQIRLHVRCPAGTRIEEAERRFADVEALIGKEIPASDRHLVLDNIGLPFGGVNLAFSGSSTIGFADGEILIALADKHSKSTDDYVAALRRDLPKQFPDMTFYFEEAGIVGQILNFGLPAPIDVQVSGNARIASQTLPAAQKILERMRRIPGAVDVYMGQETEAPNYHIDVDRQRAASAGLTERDVANSLLVSLSGSGQTAPNFFLDPKNGVTYTISVQTPEYRIDSPDALLSTPILSAESASSSGSSGSSLSAPATSAQLLRNLATLHRETAPANISHYDVDPTYDIYASISGRDLDGVARDIEKATHGVELPRGARITVRGQVDSMRTSFRGLELGLLFSLVLVYALMAINFQSWFDPLVVILGLPGAISGILWMLFVTQTHLSVPAMMGMIMGTGVATANSILIVTFANEQRGQGKNARDAALEAGGTRLRPVLMTAAAMMIGMLPMALSLSEGGEQNAPLGRAVIGALIVATFSTLFIVPILYSLMRKPDPRSAFADEERAEAEYERDNQIPFDESLPPELVADIQKKQEDGKTPDGKPEANGDSKPGKNDNDKSGDKPGDPGDGRNRFAVGSGRVPPPPQPQQNGDRNAEHDSNQSDNGAAASQEPSRESERRS